MAESLDTLKEKNRIAEEHRRYEENRHQNFEEKFKLFQRQVVFQRSEARQLDAKDANIRERLHVESSKREKELPHGEIGS